MVRDSVLGALLAAALAVGFKKHDRRCGGDVQGADATGHGDAQEVVAGLADEVVEAFAFSAHDQAAVASEVELVIVHGAALVEADDPDVFALEVFEGANEVHDAGDAEVFCGSCGGFGGNCAQGRGTAFGHDDGIDTGAVSGAEESAEILRVFNAVEGQDEAGVAGRFEDVFDGQELLGADDGDYALVGGGAGHVGEGVAGLGANADFEFLAEGDDGFEAVVAAFAGYKDVVEAAFAGLEGFFDRVDSVESLHTYLVYGFLRFGVIWRGYTAGMKISCAAVVFQVANVERAVAFYRDVLGFEQDFHFGNYAGMHRGEFYLHLCGHQIWKMPVGGGAVSVFCDEVDEYHAQVAQLGAKIEAAPADQQYGMRDFVLRDVDGNLLTFGCELAKNEETDNQG